jgi:hypothetical protein
MPSPCVVPDVGNWSAPGVMAAIADGILTIKGEKQEEKEEKKRTTI